MLNHLASKHCDNINMATFAAISNTMNILYSNHEVDNDKNEGSYIDFF